MHISKIYIQDNFVPDHSTDPFRRKVIGFEVTINATDNNVDDAIKFAENQIAAYISANKVESMMGTQVHDSEPLDKIQGLIEAISLTSSKKALEYFRIRVEIENNTELTAAFENKLLEFQ